MLTVATLLWDANRNSLPFSRMYDETWVEKLYRGFARNLSDPFRFVCYTDRPRHFAEPIEQKRMSTSTPGYGDCIQPYEMGEPMILCGLDTVITGNCDALARFCLKSDIIALPRDPYKPSRACNGVALVPGGKSDIWTRWKGENDMEWMRAQPHVYLDEAFPGAVVSFKGRAKAAGIGGASIVYFHGREKPHELPAGHPILEHWV
ncbi:hypothetical protein GCM10007908_03670 [Rhizobium albus]|nr:hypothetical protein GCM10007908_03670 [Rhizobium albus]